MCDANLDNHVNSADGRKVLRWVAHLDTYANLNEALCDVNYDNSITSADAQLVLKMAAGLIDPIQ